MTPPCEFRPRPNSGLYGTGISKSAADGRFGFDVEPPADIAIKTDGDPSATPRRAAALYPVRLAEARVMDVGVVRSPSLPDGVPLAAAAKDPQTIQAGDGLTLILHRGALTPRLGEVLIDVAARQVPAALVPRYPGLGNDQVLAVYALHPFAAKSTVPIQVKALRLCRRPGTRVPERNLTCGIEHVVRW